MKISGKFILKVAGTLTVIALVVAALLGVVNNVTKDKIAEQDAENTRIAMSAVAPEGSEFGDKMDISDAVAAAASAQGGKIVEMYPMTNGGADAGYVVQVSASGYHAGMGLFQDQTSSLSEIKRLAALVTDPSRRGEIGSDQWPLAMIAYGRVTCNESGREEEGVIIYNMFHSRCAPDARRKCALQLAAFIRQRKGDGWRALLPFAMADEAPDIRRQSAFLIYTLAAPQPEERFPGIAGLANVICASPCPGQASMAPALDALMSLGDMRFAPYLSFISKNLPPGRLADLLAETEAIPTDLGCGWLLDILDEHPELSSTIAAVLAGMPSRAGEVLDVVVPVPSWQFTNSAVQPLHSWSIPEYRLRMEERLSRYLAPEEREAVDRAWS